MRAALRLLALCILVAYPAAAATIEQPMWVSSQSPAQSLHLGILPAVPRALAPGEFFVQRSDTWTNVWIDQQPGLLIDYEAVDARLGVSVGLPRSMQLQIALEDRLGTGGRLDPLIEKFHRVIGNHDRRNSVARDSIHIEIRDPETGALLISRTSLGSFSRGLDLTLSKRRHLWDGDVSAAMSVRFPRQGSAGIDPGGMDTAVSVAWSGLAGGRTLNVGGGLTRFATASLGPIRARRIGRTMFVGVAQPTSPRTALIAQYLYNASIAEVAPLDSGSHEVAVGARFHATPQTSLDVAFIENIINFRNGPDFGFHFGLNHDIRGRARSRHRPKG